MLRYLVYCILTLTLTGCSVFSPVKTVSVDTYALTATPQPTHKEAIKQKTILITPVEATSIYNTTQMAYTTKPYQMAYFVKNRWISTPAEMLQPLIVKTLQNTHYFAAVITRPSTGHYDYVLSVTLISLQQEFTGQVSQIHLVLSVQLLKTDTQEIIGTRLIDIHQPVSEPNPYAGVIAANLASARALNEIVHFCFRKI